MMINKRLINICSESKKYVGLTVFINWLSTIANIFIILTVGKIINKLLAVLNNNEVITLTEVLKDKLGSSFLFIGFLLGIRILCNMLSGYFSSKSSSNVKVKLRDMIYNKLLKLGLNYEDVLPTSSIVQISVEGVEALEIYFSKYLPQVFYALLAPITLFAFIAFISVKAAIVFILSVPLIPISIICIMKIAKKVLKNYWNVYSDLGETFLENLQGLTTLKVFNIDEHVHKEMNEEAENFRKITMKVLSMQLNSITIMDLVAFGGAALGTIVALYEFKAGSINLGQVIIILLLSSEFFIPLRLLGSFFHIAMNGMAACDKIFTLLDADEREKPQVIEEEQYGYKTFIKVKEVTFSYDGEREVIKNLSMDIPANSFIAIVGQSGSGKSTIASLILNNYEVQKGKILFNGININDLSFDEIYSKIALISTNSYIFNGTILDNLLVGNRNASEEQIIKALKMANLYNFVNSLDNKLETNVGEGGSLLSGGQKQRLALARAILSDREIMIFDEATSNIDVESEELIWKSINELAKKKTVIVISHRLSNVVNADNIYVLNKGQLIENGNHEQLMKNEGQYFHMVKEQERLEKNNFIGNNLQFKEVM